MEPAIQLDARSRTVLVVEDEPLVRSILVRILRTHGYEVLEARDGAAALAVFEQHRDEIPLVLMDLCIPGPNGTRVAAALRAKKPDLAVIYMSGDVDGAQLTLAEGETFLRKPFAPAQLTELVQRSLEEARSRALG